MVERRTDPSLQDLHRGPLLAAAVLVAIGGALGVFGLALGAVEVIRAGRRWYVRTDLPPNQLARLKWEQAKAAAGAGVGAWGDTEQQRYTPRSGRG